MVKSTFDISEIEFEFGAAVTRSQARKKKSTGKKMITKGKNKKKQGNKLVRKGKSKVKQANKVLRKAPKKKKSCPKPYRMYKRPIGPRNRPGRKTKYRTAVGSYDSLIRRYKCKSMRGKSRRACKQRARYRSNPGYYRRLNRLSYQRRKLEKAIMNAKGPSEKRYLQSLYGKLG